MAETCFLDGPLSDRKVLRQRTIGTPFGDQLQDLAFAWSQSVPERWPGAYRRSADVPPPGRVRCPRCEAAHGAVELGDVGDPILEQIAHTLWIFPPIVSWRNASRPIARKPARRRRGESGESVAGLDVLLMHTKGRVREDI